MTTVGVGEGRRCLYEHGVYPVEWICQASAGHLDSHHPFLHDEAIDEIYKAEDLDGALFTLAMVFGVPLTTGNPYCPGDEQNGWELGNPVYHVAEFDSMVRAIFDKFSPELIAVRTLIKKMERRARWKARAAERIRESFTNDGWRLPPGLAFKVDFMAAQAIQLSMSAAELKVALREPGWRKTGRVARRVPTVAT